MATKGFFHDIYRSAKGPGSRSARPAAAESMQIPEMTAPAGSTAGQAGLMSMIKGGDWKGVMKHPGGIVAGLMLAQFLYNSMKGKIGAARDMGMEEDFIGQQAGMSEEDAYYQAALPGLTQERQATQEALMQAIMGGGQQVQVPGERRI